MNLKQLLVSATMLSVFSWYSQAQQPYSDLGIRKILRNGVPKPIKMRNSTEVRLSWQNVSKNLL